MRVTQEDAFDRQPLRDDASGLTFVSDARIDNREEIAAALAIDDEALRDTADSTLMFAAYRRWGAACAERFVGDFVFAAWDSRARTLVLGRDHMGQRHLFFHASEKAFAFATERRGLIALPDVPNELLDTLITPDDPIGFLPAGTILTVAPDASLTSHRYWSPCADPRHENRDEAYYVAAYRRVLEEAVACRLRRATRPAGLLMGGGFDTGAICALAGPVVTAQGRKFIAASSVMPEDYRGTVQHARRWVEACRRAMPHLEVRYVTREGLDIFTGMERGFQATGGGHSPNRYVIDALYGVIASTGARVVMDGFGGDYTLNPRGHRFLLMLLKTGRFRRFLSEWKARGRFLGWSNVRLFRNAILPHLFPSALRRWRRYRTGLSPFGSTLPYSKALARRIGARKPSNRSSSLHENQRRILEGIADSPAIAGSIAAAAQGLEFTQPFHDKRVVELALAIPEHIHVRDGRERHLARIALADLYPPEFQTRGPGNDDLIPDFLAMAKRIEPKVLAEIDRMEAAGKLSAYFDFPRMRRMLTRRRADQHTSGNEYDVRQAMSAFIRARHIEWFRGDNA